ncbi:hypothetical protein, partial [Paraburkholderia sediminicola]|uniref:hypothetical protein n=1 Tax=Paraburkholderia sediminicola TaxID=458836 RepID=UPI0038BAFDF3
MNEAEGFSIFRLMSDVLCRVAKDGHAKLDRSAGTFQPIPDAAPGAISRADFKVQRSLMHFVGQYVIGRSNLWRSARRGLRPARPAECRGGKFAKLAQVILRES